MDDAAELSEHDEKSSRKSSRTEFFNQNATERVVEQFEQIHGHGVPAEEEEEAHMQVREVRPSRSISSSSDIASTHYGSARTQRSTKQLCGASPHALSHALHAHEYRFLCFWKLL